MLENADVLSFTIEVQDEESHDTLFAVPVTLNVVNFPAATPGFPTDAEPAYAPEVLLILPEGGYGEWPVSYTHLDVYKRQVFSVLAFVLCFLALYFLATLLVNLFNHVLRFPVLRRIDWLLGGLFGLGRGLVIAALILSVVEPVLISFDVELMNALKQGSVTYGMLMGQNAMDFLGVRGTINDIVASASRLLT